jgi:hypothetical protein
VIHGVCLPPLELAAFGLEFHWDMRIL